MENIRTDAEIARWSQFYDINLKKQIEKTGEAHMEWNVSKSEMVKQLNYLRSRNNLKIFWSQKYADCFSIHFIQKL